MCPIGTRQFSFDYQNLCDGIASTTAMVNGCGDLHHKHPGAKACHDFAAISEADRQANGLSDWFIPSVGQWTHAILGLGFSYGSTQSHFKVTFKQFNDKFAEFLTRRCQRPSIHRVLTG